MNLSHIKVVAVAFFEFHQMKDDGINRAIRRYRCVCHLCDDTDTVAVMSNMAGVMSGIVIVFS